MDEQFTASEVRNAIPCKETRNSAMLRAYADLLEAREKAVPVAWSLIFEESIGVNAPTTYNRREDAEDYADACAMPDKCNPFPHRPKVVPLYTHPTPADADRLAEQRDDAFQQAVQEARRVWMDEFPCEAGHDHVTPFDQFLYGNRPCMEAQPPAARMTEALRNLCAEMASVAKERGVSRDQVNTYRWCKRRIMAIVADHLTKTHPQPAQDAKDAARYRWLRDHSGRNGQPYIRCDDAPFESMDYWVTAGTADACIDRAMAKESGNK